MAENIELSLVLVEVVAEGVDIVDLYRRGRCCEM